MRSRCTERCVPVHAAGTHWVEFGAGFGLVVDPKWLLNAAGG